MLKLKSFVVLLVHVIYYKDLLFIFT